MERGGAEHAVSFQHTLEQAKHVMGLQDALPIGIYTVGAQGIILSNNRTLEMWLGYGEGELVARQMHLRDVHYRPDSAQFAVQEVSFELGFQGETLLRHRNGSLVKVKLHHYARLDEQGAPYCGFGVVENLSFL